MVILPRTMVDGNGVRARELIPVRISEYLIHILKA